MTTPSKVRKEHLIPFWRRNDIPEGFTESEVQWWPSMTNKANPLLLPPTNIEIMSKNIMIKQQLPIPGTSGVYLPYPAFHTAWAFPSLTPYHLPTTPLASPKPINFLWFIATSTRKKQHWFPVIPGFPVSALEKVFETREFFFLYVKMETFYFHKVRLLRK